MSKLNEVGYFLKLACLSSSTERLLSITILNDSVMYTDFCSPFQPCRVTFVSMFELSEHKRGRKYQNRCVPEKNVVLAASASVQTIHSLKVKKTTKAYSASVMKEENDAIESFIKSLYSNCSTDFRDDGTCTAGEPFLSGSPECSKLSTETLLKFLYKINLTNINFKDHLYSLEACQKVLKD